MIAIDMRVYYNKIAKQFTPGYTYLFQSRTPCVVPETV